MTGQVAVQCSVGWLARQWLRHAPTERGKSFILRSVFPRLIPEAADFTVDVAGGGCVRARLTESTGWSLLHGLDVERAEMSWAVATASPGATALPDARANIGSSHPALHGRSEGLERWLLSSPARKQSSVSAAM